MCLECKEVILRSSLQWIVHLEVASNHTSELLDYNKLPKSVQITITKWLNLTSDVEEI